MGSIVAGALMKIYRRHTRTAYLSVTATILKYKEENTFVQMQLNVEVMLFGREMNGDIIVMTCRCANAHVDVCKCESDLPSNNAEPQSITFLQIMMLTMAHIGTLRAISTLVVGNHQE